MDHQEINTIRGQFQAGQWPQFLQMVSINGLRGWTGQSVEFNYPVVAIVGENGSGKSTLLKLAACVYEHEDNDKKFYPSSFFVETHWDRIQNVKIDARVKRGTSIDVFKYTKLTERWRVPDQRPKRNVYLLDISRTLPLDASVGYAKIARSAAAEVESAELNDEFRQRLSHVLGREYKKARFATSDVDAKRQVGLLEREWGELSQFHQGAGEDATLDLFRTLQGVPQYSLLIIDEVEASLHPRAQRRLIRFLLWLARQRRIQIVLSSHSPYVLEELPQEARILLMNGPQGLNVVYGVSPEFAMSRMDDEVHPDAHIFVEDREAAIWLREILASSDQTSDLITRIEINAVGPSNVVQLLGTLAQAGRLPYKSLAVVDGDHGNPNSLSLPGTLAPERHVFSDLKSANWPNLPARFGIGAGTLIQAFEDAMLEPDHHQWTRIVGDRVHKSATSVWELLTTEWCAIALSAQDRTRIADAIRQVVNAHYSIFDLFADVSQEAK
ncbi:ATP-binding protein [Solimonas sp. K1W22B-7]|uniref:ATP-dependent nuclease n=1 Tax=Solimonas sp. K1W22B-7 TaxID=2303331 RepID=UPI000E32E3ED|nr:ATP-binding protein [Solimonas sp. K1W22B-7]AXQ31764.1 ATP-binding protein [Solimonas sp. K1W22B-7]